MRRLLAFVTTAALALTVAACGQFGGGVSTPASDAATEKGTIGIALPTETSEHWLKAGEYLKAALEEAGYQVNLQYANGDAPTQAHQVADMVASQNQMIVLAAIGEFKADVGLADAQEAGIPVLAFDRLLPETEAVSYNILFDDFQVGVAQGTSLLEGLEASGAELPWNVELFAGSADEAPAKDFYEGAMSVLQPRIDDGTIKIVSGETQFKKISIIRWDPLATFQRMEILLEESYSKKVVNGVLAPSDSIANGVITALEGDGYGSGGKEMPIVTGMGAELDNVRMILAGEQYSTTFEDPKQLATAAAEMVKQATSGQTVTVNDTETYDNGTMAVPTMVLAPVAINKANAKQVLVDAGFYTEDELS